MMGRPKKGDIRLVDEFESEGEAAQVPEEPCPEPPEWMHFEAKCEWIRTAPSLHERGKLKSGAVALLEAYCVAVGSMRECEAQLQADGKIVNGKVHPAYKMMLDAIREIRSIAAELKFIRDINEVPQGQKSKDEWPNSLLA